MSTPIEIMRKRISSDSATLNENNAIIRIKTTALARLIKENNELETDIGEMFCDLQLMEDKERRDLAKERGN